MRGEEGQRTDEVQALRQIKPRSGFCHGPNKCEALNHCAACKGLKQCAVERCKAWCDPNAERWTAKQKILVRGACKTERGFTDKDPELYPCAGCGTRRGRARFRPSDIDILKGSRSGRATANNVRGIQIDRQSVQVPGPRLAKRPRMSVRVHALEWTVYVQLRPCLPLRSCLQSRKNLATTSAFDANLCDKSPAAKGSYYVWPTTVIQYVVRQFSRTPQGCWISSAAPANITKSHEAFIVWRKTI